MSVKLNDVLMEAETWLKAINVPPIVLAGRVVVAYDAEDLLDCLKGIKSYPAIGIVYEGMRSMPEGGSTEKTGVSCEIVVTFVLIEQGLAIHATDQKRTRAIDYLDLMRKNFMGQRSMVTGHKWHFLVESPAKLKEGMICWSQRWALPVQLRPEPPLH